jgi:small nuclear ribonucleoprotein B and B'
MNLVLADTEEFRRTRRRGKAAPGATQTVTETEERRALGLSIIRGAQVISLSVDGPPPADPAARLGATASTGPSTAAALAAGPGVARQAGRGLPVGLTGPTPGVGGPGPGFGGAFPPAPGFAPPPAFAGRGGPPGGGPRTVLTLSPPLRIANQDSAGFAPPGGPPGGFGGPPGYGGPPGFPGRGGPPGFAGR